jgi:hypothetical protein
VALRFVVALFREADQKPAALQWTRNLAVVHRRKVTGVRGW